MGKSGGLQSIHKPNPVGQQPAKAFLSDWVDSSSGACRQKLHSSESCLSEPQSIFTVNPLTLCEFTIASCGFFFFFPHSEHKKRKKEKVRLVSVWPWVITAASVSVVPGDELPTLTQPVPAGTEDEARRMRGYPAHCCVQTLMRTGCCTGRQRPETSGLNILQICWILFPTERMII